MKRSFSTALLVLVAFLLPLPFHAATAQPSASVLMLSDIHFDPFRDPAKLPQLRDEPMEHWAAILGGPASATQAADLEALQRSCGARSLDSAWPLLQQTLSAARSAATRPAFVTVAGDLLTHQFRCRFQQLAPGSTPEDVAAFAGKTVAFVLSRLQAAYPHTPIYAALGNNDSGCGDYRATPGDSFLRSSTTALSAAARVPAAAFTPQGDYSVDLPLPLQHGRLIVLQDIFETRQYETCSGAVDHAAEGAQIGWLRAQLEQARTRGEHVWVMSHVPTGIDAYSSFRQFIFSSSKLCSAKPRAFLGDSALADTLLDFPDTVRLALFGHTHMDEFRLLRHEPASDTGNAQVIPVKGVPSVSPVLGNHPAFLVASVDPRTAVLTDWRALVSPGPEGSTPPWAEGYRYTRAYRLPDFSARSALALADSLVADKTAQGAHSLVFRQNFYPGDVGLYASGLAQIWPAYACSLRHGSPAAARDCICKALPPTANESGADANGDAASPE